MLGVEFVDVLTKPCGVVFGNGEDDSLAGTDILPGCQIAEVLPGEPVKLLHHLPIGHLVSPFALEFTGVVGGTVHFRPIRQQAGDALREFIRYEVSTSECVLDSVAEVGLPVLTVVKTEGVALEVSGGRGAQSNMKGVEVSERGLPGAVD